MKSPLRLLLFLALVAVPGAAWASVPLNPLLGTEQAPVRPSDDVPPEVEFAPETVAFKAAVIIAKRYWQKDPCGGQVRIGWKRWSGTTVALSNWTNKYSRFDDPEFNRNCTIDFNGNQPVNWPIFCTVMAHEVGHLVGKQHSIYEDDVMYPRYSGPINVCSGAPPTSLDTVASGEGMPDPQTQQVEVFSGTDSRRHLRFRYASNNLSVRIGKRTSKRLRRLLAGRVTAGCGTSRQTIVFRRGAWSSWSKELNVRLGLITETPSICALRYRGRIIAAADIT